VTIYEDNDIVNMIMQQNTSSTELGVDGNAVECSIDDADMLREFTMGEAEVSATLVGEQVEDPRGRNLGENPSQYQNLKVNIGFIDGAG